MFKKEYKEMTNYLESFINEFESKYDKKIQIILTDTYDQAVRVKNYSTIWKDEIQALSDVTTSDKLNTLEDIVLKTMHIHNPDLKYIKSMVVKSRRRDIILWVQTFTYIGRKMGFTTTRIGKFINRDHATVLHSVKAVENALFTKEADLNQIYKQVLNSIKEYVGTITADPSGKNDTESILSALRNEKKSIITIEQC